MGNRLTKIYTRTGDDGTTCLGDGTRVEKDHLRIEAIGQIDHLNAFLGLTISLSPQDHIHALLTDIQHDLFELGAELCIPESRRISSEDVHRLEVILDGINQGLGRLEEFILPGGVTSAAAAHLARTSCRNAERAIISLAHRDPTINNEARRYLNRLSDLLFVVARALNQVSGQPDILWTQKRKKNEGYQ